MNDKLVAFVKLRRKHLGLNERQIKNVFNRFTEAMPEMESVIGRGFLPQQKTDEFKQLIKERAARLEL